MTFARTDFITPATSIYEDDPIDGLTWVTEELRHYAADMGATGVTWSDLEGIAARFDADPIDYGNRNLPWFPGDPPCGPDPVGSDVFWRAACAAAGLSGPIGPIAGSVRDIKLYLERYVYPGLPRLCATICRGPAGDPTLN